MWPKDVPPPRFPRRRLRHDEAPRPVDPRPGEFVLWTMVRGTQWATCYTRQHGSTMAVRLVIDGVEIWKKYLRHPDASHQADALVRKLVGDGWAIVSDTMVRPPRGTDAGPPH